MQTSYQLKLQTLLDCLEQLLKHYQQQDWQALAETEARHEEIIEELQKMKADNSDTTQALLSRALTLNNEVLELAEENKNLSEKALLKLRRNSKKTTYYQ